MSGASFTTFADSAPDTPCLTFGKHRGQPLSEIETSYLQWAKTADRITPDLLAAIEAELATRAPKTKDRFRIQQGVSDDVTTFAKLIIAAGEQEVAAAIGGDYHIGLAAELLKNLIALVELESDPGDLPF